MRGCLLKAKLSPKTMRSFKKGEFTWRIILSLGKDPVTQRWRQQWVTFHGTRQQAEQKLTELTGEVQRGEFVEPSKLTVGEWLDEWLEKAIRPPRRTANTYKSYVGVVQNNLKPGLGHLLLQQLTPLQVERYYPDSKLAPSSVPVHHAILTSALNAAINAGVLRSNIVKRATNKPGVN